MADTPTVARELPRNPAGNGTVLVVDDLPANVKLLQRLLAEEGFLVTTASDGEQALKSVEASAPDVVLMDLRMPRLDGFAACEALKQKPETRLIPVVLMTGSAQEEDRVRAIEAGADDFLTKPVDETELRARIRSLVRLKRHTDDLDSAESVILTLARTIEARDPSTVGHCERLSRYAVALGRRLGLSDEDLAALHRGGYLHDIGKVAISDTVLRKPGPLSPEEYAEIKLHSEIGERLCGSLRFLSRVRPIIRHHHERLDGSGYPDGLRGDAVPLLAQIISIVDIFDALTTSRPYKDALPVPVAAAELRKEAALGWRDMALVREFLSLVEEGTVGVPA